MTWVVVIPGLTAKCVDGASAFAYPLIFLPFISSAFVPTDTMPGPVRGFADNQPVTSIVNAIRDLFTQQPIGRIAAGLPTADHPAHTLPMAGGQQPVVREPRAGPRASGPASSGRASAAVSR